MLGATTKCSCLLVIHCGSCLNIENSQFMNIQNLVCFKA